MQEPSGARRWLRTLALMPSSVLRRTAGIVAILVSCAVVADDEDEYSVNYYCSPTKGTVAFIPIPAKDLQGVRLDSYSPQRRLLTSNSKHDLKCSLSGFDVRAQIEAFEPSSGSGFCAAANLYRLESLTVNGTQVMSPVLLNHECLASIVFLEVAVTADTAHLRTCETLPKRAPPQTEADDLSTGEIRCQFKALRISANPALQRTPKGRR